MTTFTTQGTGGDEEFQIAPIMEQKITLERIRNVRIHKILGIRDDGRKIMIKCVFHGDGTPSMLIDTKNSWYCFGCGSKGHGAIDFVVALGYSTKDAIKELKTFL